VHDFNGGIQPSGLFWLVELPADAFTFADNGRSASLHARDVPVLDSFEFFGPNVVPATVSFDLRWEATGPAVPRGFIKDRDKDKGKNTPAPAPPPPTDPAAFVGEFAPARATGSCSGSELGFAFRSNPGATTYPKGYAELGRERNGVFLNDKDR
jgi:hypothetical protein